MKELTILDGGMGRELQRIGAPFSLPFWSAQSLMEAPEYVAKAHQNFIDAGAQMITTNSYACVPFHLGQALYKKQGVTLANQAANIAKKVAFNNKDILVAGSLPPVFGSYRPDLFIAKQAKEILLDLIAAQDAMTDCWIVETVSSIEEAEVAARCLSSSSKPWYIAFTLMDDLSQPPLLRSKESVKQAVNRLLNYNVSGILLNCSIPEVIQPALLQINQELSLSNKTVITGAYANSFTPLKSNIQANKQLSQLRQLSPEEYLKFVKLWHANGARLLGGCCGIDPSHIKVLADWRDSIEKL